MFNPSRPAPTSSRPREARIDAFVAVTLAASNGGADRGGRHARQIDRRPLLTTCLVSSCVDSRGTRKNPSCRRGANASRGRSSGIGGPTSGRSGAPASAIARVVADALVSTFDSTSMWRRIVFNSATSDSARSSVRPSRASVAMWRTSSIETVTTLLPLEVRLRDHQRLPTDPSSSKSTLTFASRPIAGQLGDRSAAELRCFTRAPTTNGGVLRFVFRRRRRANTSPAYLADAATATEIAASSSVVSAAHAAATPALEVAVLARRPHHRPTRAAHFDRALLLDHRVGNAIEKARCRADIISPLRRRSSAYVRNSFRSARVMPT